MARTTPGLACRRRRGTLAASIHLDSSRRPRTSGGARASFGGGGRPYPGLRIGAIASHRLVPISRRFRGVLVGLRVHVHPRQDPWARPRPRQRRSRTASRRRLGRPFFRAAGGGLCLLSSVSATTNLSIMSSKKPCVLTVRRDGVTGASSAAAVLQSSAAARAAFFAASAGRGDVRRLCICSTTTYKDAKQ